MQRLHCLQLELQYRITFNFTGKDVVVELESQLVEECQEGAVAFGIDFLGIIVLLKGYKDLTEIVKQVGCDQWQVAAITFIKEGLDCFVVLVVFDQRFLLIIGWITFIILFVLIDLIKSGKKTFFCLDDLI